MGSPWKGRNDNIQTNFKRQNIHIQWGRFFFPRWYCRPLSVFSSITLLIYVSIVDQAPSFRWYPLTLYMFIYSFRLQSSFIALEILYVDIFWSSCIDFPTKPSEDNNIFLISNILEESHFIWNLIQLKSHSTETPYTDHGNTSQNSSSGSKRSLCTWRRKRTITTVIMMMVVITLILSTHSV